MAFTKFASLESAEVIEIKGSPRQRVASLDKLADFDDYRVGDGYMYVRIKAQSSRVNKNHDGWPSIELAGGDDIFERHAKQSSTGGFTIEASDGSKEFGFATFLGKPNFVDHHNSDPKKARGVVVDSKLKVYPPNGREASLDPYYASGAADPEHMPPTEIELLIEIDAQRFPKYAEKVKKGELDGWSMGCDVEYSKCSHCSHIATNPDEYCSHIVAKGAEHDYKTADGKRISRKSYENCYGIKYFEISGVFDPADESATTQEMRHSHTKEAENPLPQSFETKAPEHVDTLRNEQTCPVCGEEVEGDTCETCGWNKPPEGFGNPDLQKARGIEEEMQHQDTANDGNPIQGHPPAEDSMGQGPQPGLEVQKQPGSFLQNRTRNSLPTASVKSDMRWQPKLHPHVAGRINKNERPIRTSVQPATNEPTTQAVTGDQTKPVTAAMQTAQELIARAQRNHTGETMSTRTADGPTPPDAAADKRVDTTGVGGVIEPSNEQASKADAQVEVTGVGSVGVTDVGADSTTSLPTASEGGDDAGFNSDKNTEAIPTKTYDDSDGTEKGITDTVTNESLEGNQNKDASARRSYEDGIGENLQDSEISGGSANKGVQPVDAVGKAQDRVNVLDSVTSPNNNSGPTTTWSGTDGNGVLKQQEPVTTDVVWNNTDNAWTSHFIAALKVADTEVELGMITKEEKYNRLAELQAQSDAVIATTEETLKRAKTAGQAKLAQIRTGGVRKFPSQFGQRTAAPEGAFGKTFERIATSETVASEEQQLDEDTLDSGLFI